MKKVFLTRPMAVSAGILLVLPSLYFIISALLNYSFGLPSLWRVIEPIFDKPENKHLGFNINLLIILGPFLALVLNLPQVMHLHFISNPEELTVQFAIKKYGWSWIIISAALFCLASIALYLFAENCTC